MSVNKFDWITNSDTLINLPNQLQTSVNWGDVKFRTKTAVEKPFSLYELFQFVEMRSSKDPKFVTTKLLTALQTIKNQRTEALSLKAPILSPKWIYHLLVQLGRLIARFFSGCKTFNYDASLIKLCQQLNAKSPNLSTEPVKPSTFIDNQSSLYLTLAKMENGEAVTIEDFQHVTKQIVTLDLTKWKTTTEVAIISSTRTTEHVESIMTLASQATQLKKVILPDIESDATLFYGFVVAPCFRKSDVDIELPTPSFATILPLDFVEKKRLHHYFQKKNKLTELLEKNLPHATNHVVTANLQGIIGHPKNYLSCLAKNINYLFDTNVEMLPAWADWLTSKLGEDLSTLYDKVHYGNEPEKVLIPLIDGTRIAARSFATEHRKNIYSLQNSYLAGLIWHRSIGSDHLTYQAAEYLLNHNVSVVKYFRKDSHFEQFVNYFLNQTTQRDRKTQKMLSLFSENDISPDQRGILISKFPTCNFCPIDFLINMPSVLAIQANESELFNSIKNIYFAALLKILQDPQSVENQQQELLQLITGYEVVMINHPAKSLKNHQGILEELVVECTPKQLTVLMEAFFTNYIRKVTERDRYQEIIITILRRLKRSTRKRHEERIKAFFKAYWKLRNDLHEEMNIAILNNLERFQSKKDIAAIFSAADEAGVLLSLNSTWFERLLRFQYQYVHRGYQYGVSEWECVELLSQYPPLCLKLPSQTLKMIISNKKWRNQMIDDANQYLLVVNQEFNKHLPNVLREIALEYSGMIKALQKIK